MKYNINLLTLKKEKPLDKVIYFTLNYLRYILVITQIVVIGVFLYRFRVDQEIVDLEDSLNQKREIIEVSQPLIKEAKTIAFKLDQVESITNNQQTFISQTDYILSLFPENFFLKKLQISKDGLSMTGYTGDFQSIKFFLSRLKKEEKFEKIELKYVKKSDIGLEFSFEFNKFKKS